MQNTLYIKKPYLDVFLDEADILCKSTDELRSLVLDSDLILYGGIGFSAYNPQFNATHGIYRRAIDAWEEDLFYTQKSEAVYNKLAEALALDTVIILSHMPLGDWCATPMVPNWIHVNGHTHHNHCEQSDTGTVYADNQMGYRSKKHGLKYFKTSVVYDIFRYHPDGIHRITKTQYLDFNDGNRTRCTFSKEVDSILMLKRQGMYLFLLEDSENGKLFLLNGGVKNRLKITDVHYYYENMVKYSDYIKLAMGKYNEALKSISAVIKSIGGSGYIHGCIVDIDFYNHIYLDPYEGTVTAYYSPWYGERYEYPSVEQLLETKIPALFANYQKLLELGVEQTNVPGFCVSSSHAVHIHGTEQYKPSNLIKRLQYVTESNVIRLWNDDLILDPSKMLNS